MPVPTISQLVTPQSTANGLPQDSVQERILTLLAMQASGFAPDGTALPSLVTALVTPSGDTTGVKDTAALNAAIAALPTFSDGQQHGTIALGPGEFYYNASVTVPFPVYVVGAGKKSTILYSLVGSGVSTFIQHGPFIASALDANGVSYGGGFSNLTIDGSKATPGAIGLDWGDCNEYEMWNLKVQHFTGNYWIPDCIINSGTSTTITRQSGAAFPANINGFHVSGGLGAFAFTAGTTVSSGQGTTSLTISAAATGFDSNKGIEFAPASFQNGIGIWARNYNQWSEKWNGKIYLWDNDNGIVFDVTANPNDSTTHSTASHEFGNLDIFLEVNNYQNGIIVQNGASLASATLRVHGNMQTSQDSLASFNVMKVTGSVPAGHPGSGTFSNADLEYLAMSMTSNLGLANQPVSIFSDTSCEVICPVDSRYSGRLTANTGGTGIIDFGTGFQQAANAPGNARGLGTMDAPNPAVTGTTAGTVTAMQIAGGKGIKIYKIYCNAVTAASGFTVTFSQAFANTPILTQNSTTLTAATLNTTTFVSSAASAITGFLTIEGV